MTTERLDIIARRAKFAADDPEGGFETYLTAADLADLARCARAWAKVERARNSTLYLNHVTATLVWRDSFNDEYHSNGPTAIEAVEAAEVGK